MSIVYAPRKMNNLFIAHNTRAIDHILCARCVLLVERHRRVIVFIVLHSNVPIATQLKSRRHEHFIASSFTFGAYFTHQQKSLRVIKCKQMEASATVDAKQWRIQ
jgi:hypothetical protein